MESTRMGALLSAQNLGNGLIKIRAKGTGSELLKLLASLNCSVAERMLETGITSDEAMNALQATVRDGLRIAVDGRR